MICTGKIIMKVLIQKLFFFLIWTAGRLGRPVFMLACPRICMSAPVCSAVVSGEHV